MSTSTVALPITESLSPDSEQGVAQAIADSAAAGTAVYPVGGGTSLGYGLAPTRPGLALSLAKLNRVVDYPARDMTITLEAGVTMAALTKLLASEGQWLPVDAAQAESATIGGIVSTAFSGPRRFGYGTMRDYVIGVTAVDGRGVAFKAGGRVVKNVAGYDFCKLLTGSLGTLGVITQLSLKVKPAPATSAFLVADVPDLDTAERLLAALVNTAITPVAIELLAGPAWRENPSLGLATAGTQARLAVGCDGTSTEVEWMAGQLAREWEALGVSTSRQLSGPAAQTLWRDLTDFPTAPAPLVIKASLLPSRTVDFAKLLLSLDPQVSITAHAGNGIVLARFAKFELGDVTRHLIGQIQPAAETAGGNVIVLSSQLEGLTRQSIWGGATSAAPWMSKVKAQFDPHDILNPGRFVF